MQAVEKKPPVGGMLIQSSLGTIPFMAEIELAEFHSLVGLTVGVVAVLLGLVYSVK